MSDDFHSTSIEEALLKLERMPARVTKTTEAIDKDQYQSLRQLARSRVALALRQLRAANGLSYAQVQTDTGLSQQLLFDVEFGERRLTIDELKLLADCYGASIDDILGVNIE